MDLYYVFVWWKGEWEPIKEFTEVNGELIPTSKPNEIMGLATADARCEMLRTKHPEQHFKVKKMNQ